VVNDNDTPKKKVSKGMVTMRGCTVEINKLYLIVGTIRLFMTLLMFFGDTKHRSPLTCFRSCLLAAPFGIYMSLLAYVGLF